jgi:hypothetical protein
LTTENNTENNIKSTKSNAFGFIKNKEKGNDKEKI